MNRTAQCIVKAAQLRARADKLEKVALLLDDSDGITGLDVGLGVGALGLLGGGAYGINKLLKNKSPSAVLLQKKRIEDRFKTVEGKLQEIYDRNKVIFKKVDATPNLKALNIPGKENARLQGLKSYSSELSVNSGKLDAYAEELAALEKELGDLL